MVAPNITEITLPQKETENAGLRIPAYIFIFGSMVSFAAAFLPQAPWPPYVPITTAVLAFIFGYILLSVGTRRAGTISPEDKDLFKSSILDNAQNIERYKTLRSLAGIPGFFRNLGIIGLPLATLAITVLFCLLGIACYAINAASNREVIPLQFSTAILELSKLTLGAFLGSFVGKSQRTPGTDDIGSSQRTLLVEGTPSINVQPNPPTETS
ncbi:MAG TPA: hypothetical protein VGN95_22805 [Pyrinomonadaceae bacterium]|jgi:hypothetical protein|nr:hypothetical protein [Pyrinomonadaceae bacterium]